MVELDNIETQHPCAITGSRSAIVICQNDRHGQALRNVISKESGLIFVDPVPFESTEDFYKTEYRKSYKGVHQPKSKHVYRAGRIALQRFSRVAQYIPYSASCLDAGSSSGEFVYLLTSRGFNAEGVEANIPYAKYSQSELQIPVTISPFSKFKTGQKFDLITMFHVLEHLEFPERDLAHLRQFLKPNGYFIIEVPNILYPNMSFPHKWHPGHLFSFTDQTLSLLMEKAGFETVSCSPIDNGGNLWGVFRRKESKNGKPILSTSKSLYSSIFETLMKQRAKYYFNPYNLFKFVGKLSSAFSEKVQASGLSGKEILDKLFQSRST